MTVHYMTILYNFFFFNDTPPTEIYPLPLHDALPISRSRPSRGRSRRTPPAARARASRAGPSPSTSPRSPRVGRPRGGARRRRSEEHTSELQSQSNLVCRLLLEKKKKYGCTANDQWDG